MALEHEWKDSCDLNNPFPVLDAANDFIQLPM